MVATSKNWSLRTMLRLPVCPFRFLCIFALALGVCANSTAFGEEPVEDYLAALQERGYFDVAVRYLDRMNNSDLAPASFKSEAEYRSAMLTVTAARASKSAARRQQLLDQARNSLESFIRTQPQHQSVSLARNQLGNILVERARALKTKSESDTANQKELAKQSFDTYEEAYDSLNKSKKEIGEQYTSLVTQRDPDSKAQLKRIKTQYIQTYLALGRILFEQAETVKDDNSLYEQKLQLAADEFDEVAQKYRAYSAGLYATLYQGECYQLLGEDKRALNYYKELMQNPDNSAPVRTLKTRALARSIEGWIKTDANQGPAKAIKVAEDWLKTKRGAEDRQPAWLDLKMQLATAHFQQSKVAKGDTQANRAIRNAREIATELAKRKSDVQKEAQQLLVTLGSAKGAPAEKQDTELAATFLEARDAAKQSLDRMKLSNTAVSLFQSQLRNVKNPELRSEIEGKLAEARVNAEALNQKTLELFEHAESLATPDDSDSLSGIRYYIAFLNYSQENYRKAAVIAGHTALANPDSVAAKQCASVALAARQRLYQLLPEEDRSSQALNIAQLGKLIVSRWPGDNKADAAMATLMDVSIAQGDLGQAETYLTRIPEGSPSRTSAELRMGQKLWREYLRGVAAEDSQTELDALKNKAKELLARGVDGAKQQSPSDSSIRGALSLAKLYADTGEPAKAIELLNDPNIGGITLIQSKSPWPAKIPGLVTDAYSTAIRANIANATNGNSAASVAAAQDMLESLQQDLSSQPGGDKKMIGIYINLARDLEQQLAVASPSDKASLSKGFESFLEKAAEGTNDVAVLNWVGQTYYGMGKGLVQGSKRTPEAQRYFSKAAEVYDRLLQVVDSPDQALQIRVKQAMTLRELGKFDQAIDLFAEVLKQKKFLNIQVEAAETFQRWGQLGNLAAFDKAIAGDRTGSDGKNIIWGWGRIAKLIAKNEANRSTFHLARYNIASSRYEMAKRQSGAEQKATLQRAKSDLMVTHQLYDLGDAKEKKRYETLLRKIQKSLGEPVKGFSK